MSRCSTRAIRTPAPQLVERIFGALKEVNEGGVRLLLVEQNAHKALQLAHRAYVLETGSIVMFRSSRRSPPSWTRS